jgi:hypothetical protein
LNAARDAANHPWPRKLLSSLSGKDIDRAYANIHEAETNLMRLVTDDELAQLGPSVLAASQNYLPRTDPRRRQLERLFKDTNNEITPGHRDLAISTLLASSRAEESERTRARSFRNILMVSTGLATILAVTFVVWGFLAPSTIGDLLCFEPRNPFPPFTLERICPTGDTADGSDPLLVEAFGAAAAAFVGARSLTKLQLTARPYSIPVLLLLLRIPVGALAALLGLILIHGGFIPGLSNLDNGPQIVAWAILFGILQEGVTHLVDRQGSAVLSNIHGSEREFQPPEELEANLHQSPPSLPAPAGPGRANPFKWLRSRRGRAKRR